MASEAREFIATIPAGTPIATPATVNITMPPRVVERIDWHIPRGALGVMGWRLTMGGVQVVPFPSTPWVITDGRSGSWQVEDLPDSGAWQVTGYNTGANPHSVYLTFHVRLPARRHDLRPLLRAAELGPAPDLSKAGPPLRVQPWPS